MEKRPPFVPGLTLAEGFFIEAVEPVIDTYFAGLRYSAALIGHGSEVFGFDNEMSMDHHWGPRVMVFLSPDDHQAKAESIRELLRHKLPHTYRGFATNFSPPDFEDHGTQMLRKIVSGPVNHRVELLTVKAFFKGDLGIDLDTKLDPADWLTLPFQKLRTITAGKVFRDDLGLEQIRSQFKWYPHDVWLYIMASAWARIGQEEHLMGRAGIVGDEIGSALIGSRLIRDIMRLVFLMEKEYPPYPKWLGTAFSALNVAPLLNPILVNALRAKSWQERETYLCGAYEALAELHNNLNITTMMPSKTSQFFGRPFRVIKGESFTKVLLQQIKDPRITERMKRSPIGNIDLFSDNTDLLEDPAFRIDLKGLYQ
jgi:hypothetical protein